MHFSILDMILKILSSLLIVLFPTILTTQSNATLQAKIEKLSAHRIFESSNLSISVFDIATNTEVAGFRPAKVLAPASSQKLLTTFSCLKYLGQDFRFQTSFGYKGTIMADGTLDGDVIIKGGGDPTLGSDKVEGSMDFDDLLDHLSAKILEAGISCIQGNIIVDESIFDSYPVSPSWQWNDLGNYYASGAWGLNVNENQYYVYFKNRIHIGHRPKLSSIYPYVPDLQLSNELQIDSAGTGDQAYIFGGPYNYNKRIVGTIPQGDGSFSIRGSLPDPPEFFAYHLKQKLSKCNIQAGDIKTVYRPSRLKYVPIDTVYSPELSTIIKTANTESNNLYTEAMLKMLGYVKRGQGSGQNGIASIYKLLRSYGIKTKPLHLHDGSGLSVRNQLSSRTLAKFLSSITKDLDIQSLIRMMPKAGYSGTVRGMLSGSPAKGKVWLKSGSMQAIQSYTGYVKTKDGNWCSFSIMINGYAEEYGTIRRKLEQMITAIYETA